MAGRGKDVKSLGSNIFTEEENVAKIENKNRCKKVKEIVRIELNFPV